MSTAAPVHSPRGEHRLIHFSCSIVYKEVTQTMTMSSSHTKHHMEDMHENIAVMRHPDHMGGEVTLMWSHRERISSPTAETEHILTSARCLLQTRSW